MPETDSDRKDAVFGLGSADAEGAVAPSLRTQGSWLFLAKLIGFAFSFALPLIIVRALQQSEVGTYRQAFQLISNLAALLPLGMSMSAYYYLVRDPRERNSAIFNILLFNGAMGAIAAAAMAFFPGLVGSIFHNPEIERLSALIGIATFFWVFSSLLEVVAVANNEIEAAAYFITFSQFSKMALMAAAVFLFANVEAFIFAAILQGALQGIVLFFYLASRFPRFWLSFDFSFLRRHLAYAIPYGASGMLWIIQTDIHMYFVGNQFSPAEYAIYVYGCLQIPLISLVTESVSSLLIPRMSQLQLNDQYREILVLATRVMHALAFYFFPLYALLLITSKTFITSLLTPSFAGSIPIFVVNLTLLPTFVFVNDPIIRSFGDLGRFLLRMRIASTIFLVGTLLLLDTSFGLIGIITAVVAVALIEKAILTIVVLRKLQASRADTHLFRPTLKVAICTLVAGCFAVLFYARFSQSIHDYGYALAATIVSPQAKGLSELFAGGLVISLTAAIFLPIYIICTKYFGVFDEASFAYLRSLIRRRIASFGIP
jgi:O-antigen/teichoic acid export membrane protein